MNAAVAIGLIVGVSSIFLQSQSQQSITCVYDAKEDVFDMDISRKRNTIVFSTRHHTCLLGMGDKEIIRKFKTGRWPSTVLRVSPCEDYLACGIAFGGVKVFSISTGQLLFDAAESHKEMVVSLSFSSDSSKLASVCLGSIIKVWDLKRKAIIHQIQHSGKYTRAIICSNLLITSCSDGKVRVWDMTDWKLKREIRAHASGQAFNFSTSSFDKTFVTIGHDSKICWWDAASFKIKRSAIDEAGDRLSFASVSPNRRFVAVCGRKYMTIRLNANGKCLSKSRVRPTDKLFLRPSFSASGTQLYFLARGGRIFAMDVPRIGHGSLK